MKKANHRRMNQEVKAVLYIVIGAAITAMLTVEGLHMHFFETESGWVYNLKATFIILGIAISIAFMVYGMAFLEKKMWEKTHDE